MLSRRVLSGILAIPLIAGPVLGGLGSPVAATEPTPVTALAVIGGKVWIRSFDDRQQLVDDRGGVRTATWSPEGDRIAVTRDGRLEVLDVGASAAITTVPNATHVLEAAWSPLGDTFIFTRSVNGRLPSVWTVNLDGSQLTRLAAPGRCSAQGFSTPSLSPDGEHYLYRAFVRSGDPTCKAKQRGLVIRSLDDDSRLVVRGGVVPHPDFSADGEWVVLSWYVDGSNTYSETIKVDVATGAETEVQGWDFGCVEGESCLGPGGTTSTPGGGFAIAWDSGGPPWNDGGVDCLTVVEGTSSSDCFVDPDFEVEGDEYGFPWSSVSWFDIRPDAPAVEL